MIASKQVSVCSDADQCAGLGQVDQSRRPSGLEFCERVFFQGSGRHEARTRSPRKGFNKRAKGVPACIHDFIGVVRRIKAVQSCTAKEKRRPVQSVGPKHIVAKLEEWQLLAS